MPDWTHQIQQILSMIGNVFITKMRAVVADPSKPIHLMHSSTYELPVHCFHSTEGDGAIAWVVKFNLAKKDDVHSTVMGAIHSLIYFGLLNHHSSQHNHNNYSASLHNIYTHKTTSIWSLQSLTAKQIVQSMNHLLIIYTLLNSNSCHSLLQKCGAMGMHVVCYVKLCKAFQFHQREDGGKYKHAHDVGSF